MLKVGIIGCGKIANDHAEAIRRVAGCEIVAACDTEPLMAEQLCDLFKIAQPFTDVSSMIGTCRPNVVHITTPPQSHFALAKQCLENGSHVYVEKPFTLHAEQAKELIELANTLGLKITVGHDLQFSHVARRMRQLVKQGYLGGPAIHMESYYCYDLSDPKYARALISDQAHWVRSLPGKLLHNVISHGIARIAEFLPSDSPEVYANGFISPLLRSMGEREIIDELRVIISDPAGPTAYFTFSSQMRPSLNLFRIFGPGNGLELDQEHETLIRLRGQRFVSYADKFVPPVMIAGQHLSNLGTNLRKFAANDFHMKAGMKFLIESFYRSIREGAAPPIPFREILLVARIMDAIFDQLNGHSQSDETLGAHSYRRVPMASVPLHSSG